MYKPSDYLRDIKKEYKKEVGSDSRELIDNFVALLLADREVEAGLHIPDTIAPKYHKRMLDIWVLMALNTLLARSTKQISFRERHKLLENTISATKGSR